MGHGRKAGERDTPLGRYLSELGMTNTDFAKRCSELTGWHIHPQAVCMWATGIRTPNRASRRMIAEASYGRVPVDAWEIRKSA